MAQSALSWAGNAHHWQWRPMVAGVLRPGKHFHVLPLIWAIPIGAPSPQATASIYGRLSLGPVLVFFF